MKKSESQFTDTTYRKYQNSNYEKTADGWVKKVEQTQQTPSEPVKKEYTDEELAEYAKKASDESLRKAGAGRDERMRVAAKKELLRRKNEGMPEPEKSDNPFDEGMEKGLFDEFPTKTVLGKEYINKGQGWEILEKGKRATIGEVRTWSGEKYQRTKDGWKYIGKAAGSSKPAKKEEPVHEEIVVKKYDSVADAQEEGTHHDLESMKERGYSGPVEKVTNEDGITYYREASFTGKEPKPEFVVPGTLDPVDDPDYATKESAIDWDLVDLANYKQRIEFLGKLPSGKYGIKYFSPNGKSSSVSEFIEADYKRNLEQAKAQIAKETKPASPWPDNVDKLTSRSDIVEIDNAADEVAEALFNEEYPDPEVYYQEQIEESKKYSWIDSYPEDPESQKRWKENKKLSWIQRRADRILGLSGRGPALSKTAKIANIKGAWQGIAKKKEAAEAKAKSEAYVASEEGTKAVEDYKNTSVEIATKFQTVKNNLKSHLISVFEKVTGLSTGDMKFNLGGYDTLQISGISDSSWKDVEVSYGKGFGGDRTREYKVQTMSYGSIAPDSKEVQAMKIQLDFLTNPELIEATKITITGVSEAREMMRQEEQALREKYPLLESEKIEIPNLPEDWY